MLVHPGHSSTKEVHVRLGLVDLYVQHLYATTYWIVVCLRSGIVTTYVCGLATSKTI